MDLGALAERPWFIILSYVLSFGPWGILFAVDFISPKWRSIRTTRRSGIAHLIFSIFPLGVAVFYLVAQREKGDYKEMMAACVAALLALYHLWRTVIGLIQLHAYKSWCTKALAWLRKHDLEDRVSRLPLRRHPDWRKILFQGIGRSIRTDQFREKITGLMMVSADIDTRMLVNNQVIDNEFFSCELPVRIRWKKIFRSPFHEWICSKDLVRCSLRWTIAILSHFGRTFLHQQKPEKYPATSLALHLPYNVKLPSHFHEVLRVQKNLVTTDKLFYNAGALDDVDTLLSQNRQKVRETEFRMDALQNIDMKQVLLFLAAVSNDLRAESVPMQSLSMESEPAEGDPITDPQVPEQLPPV